MQGDVKDWNENLQPHEKHLVGNILLGFAQTECAVSDYWTGMVTKWFPKHEIRQMAMAFGSQETIHSVAYSYLNETLGLDDFEGFLYGERFGIDRINISATDRFNMSLPPLRPELSRRPHDAGHGAAGPNTSRA